MLLEFYFTCPKFVFAEQIKDKLVYFPMTFYSEINPIKSSACLEVSERAYLTSKWWVTANGKLSGVELQLREVVDAMKKGDKDRLWDLSDRIDGHDTKEFNDQASAFFQQIKMIEIVDVPKSYIFDGLIVFLAKLQAQDKFSYITLAFAAQTDGTYKFLPYDTKHISYLIFNGWVNAPWGINSDNPSYCDAKAISDASYKIPLGAFRNYGSPSFLYFNGSNFEANTNMINGDMKLVTKTFDSINNSNINDIEKFASFFTRDFGDSLKTWLKTAPQSEKDRFESQIKGQHPIFLINAKPLYIVYSKNALGLQVWYLISNGSNGNLVISNMSHLTISDNIFKAGLLFEEAKEDRPFDKFKNVNP